MQVMGKNLTVRAYSKCKGPETTMSLTHSRKQCGQRVGNDKESSMKLGLRHLFSVQWEGFKGACFQKVTLAVLWGLDCKG